MKLSTGARLGPYEVVAPLGAGGMGEVLRARDGRLNRDVAIKVLPVEVSADPERVKRFEKEARSASALNHPNIVTIHDAGTSDGVSWIAMELVEGQTLRELVSAGAMPVKKLLAIATQVADGLATAHESGIVHRDLKPENVMVTKAGLVKILDFGLAKLTGPVSGSGEHSQLPTMSGTTPGIIVGTVGYMSPEQASGHAVDYRSDQFAFGSILYEMATGRRAFQKKTAVDTLSAILNEEPEAIGSVSPQTPPPLRWIVVRCLEKDRDNRYVSTRDLARELASVQVHLSEAISGPVTPEKSRRIGRSRAFAAIAAGAVLVASALLGQRWWLACNAKTAVPTFRQLTFRRGNLLTARFSPDGKTVAYAASWDGAPAEVFTVRTDSQTSSSLGLTQADVMSVSSKGELAVLLHKKDVRNPGVTGTLARVSLAGGTPREILDDVVRADWAPNGEDLAVIRLAGGRYRLEYPIATLLHESDDPLTYLRVSPNGNLVACFDGDELVVIDRKGQRRALSTAWGPYLAWSPRGDEIVMTGSRAPDEYAVYAVSLSGRVRVWMTIAPGLALHDVAADGRLLVEDFREYYGIACQPGGTKRERELAWLSLSFIRGISADGKYIVFCQTPPAPDPDGIYLRKTDGSPAVRLGEGAVQALSTDARWVLALTRPGRQLAMIPTGPGAVRKIPIDGFEIWGAEFLPNDRGFFVMGPDKSGRVIAGIVGPEGGKPRTLPLEGFAANKSGFVSPDGDRAAYVTTDRRVRIVSCEGGGASDAPGEPLDAIEDLAGWSSDGRFVFVVRAEVPTRIDRLDLSTGRRELWKSLMPEDPTGVLQLGPFAIAPDGQSYAYSYIRGMVDDLYVVDGAR